MFSHVTLGTDDIEVARRFYDAALGALGVAPGVVDASGRLIYMHDGGRLLVTRPLDGAPATGANGGTLGFLAASTDAADAWHAVGQAHGGTPCEDPPGPRTLPDGRILYLAYLRDPAGNKLCALHRIRAAG